MTRGQAAKPTPGEVAGELAAEAYEMLGALSLRLPLNVFTTVVEAMAEVAASKTAADGPVKALPYLEAIARTQREVSASGRSVLDELVAHATRQLGGYEKDFKPAFDRRFDAFRNATRPWDSSTAWSARNRLLPLTRNGAVRAILRSIGRPAPADPGGALRTRVRRRASSRLTHARPGGGP